MISSLAADVVVDANILLLLIVGESDIRSIERFKRTSHFSKTDYKILSTYLSNFTRVVTTPYILTEVNGMLNQSKPPLRELYLSTFSRLIENKNAMSDTPLGNF